LWRNRNRNEIRCVGLRLPEDKGLQKIQREVRAPVAGRVKLCRTAVNEDLTLMFWCSLELVWLCASEDSWFCV
jgi:hypothetical protein